MILSKKFDCTFEDLDSVIVALAKEIEDGWHIGKIENHGIKMCTGIKIDEPEFSIEIWKKDRYQQL